MAKEASLPASGRWWERKVFGVCTGKELLEIPQYKSLHDSMQEIMQIPLTRVGEDGQIEIYEPMNPTWGMSGKLWFEVMRNLPELDDDDVVLSLYIACRPERTSLDYHHGVDAFFFWNGVIVRLDAALFKKKKKNDKAHFIITPKQMRRNQLFTLGWKIAQRLQGRILPGKQEQGKKCL